LPAAGSQHRSLHLRRQPPAANGVADDVGEVVVPVAESVVGQLQRPPGGLLAAEVAELAGDVVAQSPRAVATGEVLYIAWKAVGLQVQVRFVGSNRMCRNPLATVAVIAPLWCVVRSAGAGSPVSASPRARANRSAHPWRPVSARPARALRHRQPRRDIAG